MLVHSHLKSGYLLFGYHNDFVKGIYLTVNIFPGVINNIFLKNFDRLHENNNVAYCYNVRWLCNPTRKFYRKINLQLKTI